MPIATHDSSIPASRVTLRPERYPGRRAAYTLVIRFSGVACPTMSTSATEGRHARSRIGVRWESRTLTVIT
jgi:hypothetical protein